MLSRVEARKKTGLDSANGKLLNEIETINKALYVQKNLTRTSIPTSSKTHLPDPKSKQKYGSNDPLSKDKKSIWNWKPLKALSNVRNRRFNCCFSLKVHTIEKLPAIFDDVSLCVNWKRRDGSLVTRPVKVSQGIAEFEEKLTHTCSVYGSRNGPHHSAKYEAKHFLLYASVFSSPELDLGKHRVDLSRLLPLTLEELEEEKCSGEWATSFKLSGKAKGAIMSVSFGYTVIGDNLAASGSTKNIPKILRVKQNNTSMLKPVKKFGSGDNENGIRHLESLPSIVKQHSHATAQSAENIKDLHEVVPVSKSELADSMNVLYQKFDEENVDALVDYKPELDMSTEHLEPIKAQTDPTSESDKENADDGCEDRDFSVIEHGIELPAEEQVKEHALKSGKVSIAETVEVVETCAGVSVASKEDPKMDAHFEDNDCYSKEDEVCSKQSLMKELESALHTLSNMEEAARDSPEAQCRDMEIRLDCKADSIDDDTETVASEFLSMLGIEHSQFSFSSESEPESPRERLLREFEKETLASGYSLFDFDIDDTDQETCGYDALAESGWANISENFVYPSSIQAAEEEDFMETQAMESKTRAKILEDLETEALMREWGLNDTTFQNSPPKSSGGFGSPVDLCPEEPPELPPLGEGLGSFLQTNNGGFLRSMNPTLFNNAGNGGSLIMQVSSPVVVPAEMGSGAVEILQRLASVGIEKLSMQANKLMPLEDITGNTMQQVALEASLTSEEPERHYLQQHELEVGEGGTGGQKRVKGRPSAPRYNRSPNSVGNEIGSEYVSLEDLAPLAMDKIEALSLEGLRIQSGLSGEVAPSNINTQPVGDISALKGKAVDGSGFLGLEGTAGLQLLDMKDTCDNVDGLMGLSLTLDEWMRLDSGEIDDEDQISERTSKILAAHHAASLDVIRGGMKGERKRGKGSSRKCGLLGNNFTVALMVQLHDPLRNYEPVGTPMLALIQVERVFVPPKPKIYSTVSELRNNNEEDDEPDTVKEEVKEDIKESTLKEGIPQFIITEVHVAGLKNEPGRKKLWGTSSQQQSGSRWLLANGMGRSNKYPVLKSKAASKSETPVTTKAHPGDTLWNISRVHGNGTKWKK
ncbi:protein PLASTID MOVEMENT IMPAIRED 1-RELATED 1-like [Tripterygium wilfordii]|uniref:protein PLASTID MOVEMENT IMPAIRED 1-RELATED 1-like n=1 Tax=Tripterygium wilfordii TaxID=458696 RepID=UPI0018F8624D|nr:protein PLASTID MOVEMENT IMPAIRED 1-RELATED 1-like [Tripterygium wilfordii]XP_038710180.1 protein PLASTID MOVEMENT IMPAIRED 1-RELATED 1-like [Tripterygium wilfordii]